MKFNKKDLFNVDAFISLATGSKKGGLWQYLWIFCKYERRSFTIFTFKNTFYFLKK